MFRRVEWVDALALTGSVIVMAGHCSASEGGPRET